MNQHKYERIDKGIPRIAQKAASIPEHSKAGLLAMNADKPLAHVEPREIVDKYLGGQSIIQIAAELGVHHTALYRFLWQRIPDDWPHIRASRAEGQYDSAMEKLCDIDTPMDGLTIARTREAARFRFGELGVLRRQFAQQKQELNINTQGPVTVQVVEYGAPTSDNLPALQHSED